MDEKVKEATQTTEGMQRDEGELADQKEMGEEESECMHVEMLSNMHYNSITLLPCMRL